MFNNIKRLFSPAHTIKAMGTIEQVKLDVPDTAQYVTLVGMVVLSEPIRLSMPAYSIGGKSISVQTDSVDIDSMTSAYMLHDGQVLTFIHDRQTLFSTPLKNIATLESLDSVSRKAGYYNYFGGRNGFVCNLHNGKCILISTPMPVATDEATHFKTIGRMTDITGGWSKQLAAYGIQMIY